MVEVYLHYYLRYSCRSQWSRSAVARLLRLWVRIPPGAWKFVCCECCVMLGRGLCDGLITRPEESYRLWCVVVCDLETSWMRRPTGGCCAKTNKPKVQLHVSVLDNSHLQVVHESLESSYTRFNMGCVQWGCEGWGGHEISCVSWRLWGVHGVTAIVYIWVNNS